MTFELTLGDMALLLGIAWLGAWTVGVIDGWFLRRHMESDD